MHERVMEVVAYLRERDPNPDVAADLLEQIVRETPRAAPVLQLQPLTRKQRRVFDFVKAFIATQGYPPTLESIAQHFGHRTLSTASEHLKHLQEKGWITRVPNKPGSLQITPEAANA